MENKIEIETFANMFDGFVLINKAIQKTIIDIKNSPYYDDKTIS